jgi:DNA-binding MurR/RpiR family transcriptional regulator
MIKSCKQVHIIAVGNTSPLSQYMGFRLGRLGIKCTYNVLPEYFMNHVNLADPEDYSNGYITVRAHPSK